MWPFLNVMILLIEKVQLKRLPAGPREARTISTQSNAPVTLAPLPYDTTI
jgi:large subunit ribosomal protein L21e